jgi:hypothetical protein
MAADSWFDAPIRRVVGGRRVLLVGGVPQVWPAVLDAVRRGGATDVLVVATEGDGVGERPECDVVTVPRPDGLSILERIRRGAEVQRRPPVDVIAAVDRFDPDASALAIGTFLNECAEFLGRPFLNHRRPTWLELEDKTVIDAVWDRCGIARAPAEVVPVAAARAAAARLDRGDGTVWAADASEGWHGGAALTRWIVDAADADAAERALGAHAAAVRVMPFLEGIPCSIHGLVLPDGVVALRPVEMVTLRRGRELFYAGCATFWDPPDDVREEMRAVARTVGAHLASTVAYRGPFTVDGVATVDGFRPTELNPRAGAGLNTMSRGLPDGFPLMLLLELIGSGVDLARAAGAIEAELLASADEHRSGGTWRFDAIDPQPPFVGRLRHAADRWCVDGDDERSTAPRADVLLGPGAARCALDPATWPAGPSIAPAAAAFYGWCDAERGTSFGTLAPAPDVTAG